ncbi:MAG: hypothetical protein AMXMBFR84_07400 [Candidatus Hydrogenedentota bacterium]
MERAPLLVSAPDSLQLICSDVWGGIDRARLDVKAPGLNGLIYAHPSGSHRGGDVYYLTACSAGLMARMCLADVAGHGEQVSDFSTWLHNVLRRHMNLPKPDKILQRVNRLVNAKGVEVMSTAAVFTYYATNGTLNFGYAGHPHALVYRADRAVWEALKAPASESDSPRNVTFGVIEDVHYDLGSVKLSEGDRFIVYSDGVTESMSPDHRVFGDEALLKVLSLNARASNRELGDRIVEALCAHTESAEPSHDDVTFMLFEVAHLMRGSKTYHFMKNRVRKALRH